MLEALKHPQVRTMLHWLDTQSAETISRAIDKNRGNKPAGRAHQLLKTLAERKLLHEFVVWAAHPAAGLIYPSDAAKPIPDLVKDVMEDYLFPENRRRQQIHDERRKNTQEIGRRDMLRQMCTGGAIGAATGGGVLGFGTSLFVRHAGVVGVMTATGAAAGGLLGSVVGGGKSIHENEVEMQSHPTINDGKISIDDLTHSTGRLLEALYEQENARGPRSRTTSGYSRG